MRAVYGLIVSTAVDLVLCAVDPGNGRARFGPELSYALAVAEMADLARAGLVRLRGQYLVAAGRGLDGDPLTDTALRILKMYDAQVFVGRWVADRGPRRINAYVEAAAEAGIVTLSPRSGSALGRMTVADPGRVRLASRRLAAVLDDPVPESGDRVYAVLADAARVAAPHLRGRGNRARRARLEALRQSAADAGGDAADEIRMLSDGLKAIAELSALARSRAAGSTIDEQIGLSGKARQMVLFRGWR